MYLSISPEVDNPDDLSGGEEPLAPANETSGARKRSDSPSVCSGTMEPPPKQMRGARDSVRNNPSGMTFSIDLPGAPTDDVSQFL